MPKINYPFKFVCTSDSQLQLSAPAMRRDASFLDSIIAKFDYLFAHAERIGAQAVLHAGDLLNNPKVDPEVLTETMDLIDRWNIPLICTVGNHDCKHNMVGTYKKKSHLSVLEKHGVNVLISGNSLEIHSTESKNPVVITGYGFNEPETMDLLDGMAIRKHDCFEIALVHATIFGTKEIGGSKWIGAKNLKGPDVAYFGDVHDDPWADFHHKSGTRSFNLGALARITKTEVNRKIKFLELHVNADDRVFQFYERDVPVAPGEQVFDIEKIEKIVVENAEQALAAVARAKASKGQDPVELARHVGATLNEHNQRIYTPEQVTLLLKTLEVA